MPTYTVQAYVRNYGAIGAFAISAPMKIEAADEYDARSKAIDFCHSKNLEVYCCSSVIPETDNKEQ